MKGKKTSDSVRRLLGSGGESVSPKAAGQLPRSGTEWQPAHPATLLTVSYRANKTAAATLLQQLETGVPRALGIYLEHGLCPGPHQQSQVCFNDVALNNLMPASC